LNDSVKKFKSPVTKNLSKTFSRIVKKEKNQCPREGMFSGSFAKARGRDEG
jgi:hypothetical protein